MINKKNVLLSLGLVVISLVMAGCSEDGTSSAGITWESGFSGTTEMYPVVNQSSEIKFKAESSWKASCSAKWLTFSPKSGEKGNQVITVATTSTNRTKNTRTAQLTIESGGSTKTVTIKQSGEYAVFEHDELNFTSDGGPLNETFVSSLDQDNLFVYATDGIDEWIQSTNSNDRTRQEYKYSFQNLRVQPNTSKDPRTGAFFLTMKDKSGNPLALDTLFIYQEGASDGYQSTDYSQDGKVSQLNIASQGKGIPIVIMGDGFVDKEIADGSYSRTINQAMEHLFSEEPIKSLREYFDLYQVTAVSKRNIFDGTSSTVFGTVPDHQTMGIDVDASQVMKYVKKVEGIDSIHALAVVIMNMNINKGVTYMMASKKNTDYSYAIALCPVIDSLKSEMFRSVLVHEAVGHGFAKLADEYVRSTEGSATDDDIKELKERHEKYGWFLNVDSEKDSTKVLWTKFIYDAEFSNEKIGTYEGGYTFFKGVYRPSEESMMRSNDAPFNAPSRQVIYNKVMKMALDRTPTYQEFVEFDKAHKPTTWKYRDRTRQSGGDIWRPAPPRIIWR
jgi:hypothetical protein